MHTSHLNDEKGNQAGFLNPAQPNRGPIFPRKRKGRNDDKADVLKELEDKQRDIQRDLMLNGSGRKTEIARIKMKLIAMEIMAERNYCLEPP